MSGISEFRQEHLGEWTAPSRPDADDDEYGPTPPSRAVVVYHASYGCDTGCCGHRIVLLDPVPSEWPGDEDDIWETQYLPEVVGNEFSFDHPYASETDEEFARRLITETLGAKHVADLDWEHCLVVDD